MFLCGCVSDRVSILCGLPTEQEQHTCPLFGDVIPDTCHRSPQVSGCRLQRTDCSALGRQKARFRGPNPEALPGPEPSRADDVQLDGEISDLRQSVHHSLSV